MRFYLILLAFHCVSNRMWRDSDIITVTRIRHVFTNRRHSRRRSVAAEFKSSLFILFLSQHSRNPGFSSSMRVQWPPTCPFQRTLSALCLSPFIAYAMAARPKPPDAHVCSTFFGQPLIREPCQAAVDNLPRGTLPSIFTTRAHTATNNYIQVPIRYGNTESNPSCMVTVDLDGHSRTDQFVFVPWDEIRKLAQLLVDSCVSLLHRGGFITYGVARTFESLLDPTSYWGGNAEIPTPAWVWQPDGTIESIAVPSTDDDTTFKYSKFGGSPLDIRLAS